MEDRPSGHVEGFFGFLGVAWKGRVLMASFLVQPWKNDSWRLGSSLLLGVKAILSCPTGAMGNCSCLVCFRDDTQAPQLEKYLAPHGFLISPYFGTC